MPLLTVDPPGGTTGVRPDAKVTVLANEGSFASVRELVDDIWKYLADRNANPQRYIWKAKGEEILRKIQRAREAQLRVEQSHV